MEKNIYLSPRIVIVKISSESLMGGSPLNGVYGNTFEGTIEGGGNVARIPRRRNTWRNEW